MTKTLNLLTILLFGALTFALAGKADATSHIKSLITTEVTYQSGSDQAKQVKEWLIEHAAYVNGAMIGDPDKLGSVQISYTHTSGSEASTARPMDINGPPVPLPLTGNPGDVISITSTTGGATQTWTYTWVGSSTMGNWHLTSYIFKENPR